LSRLYLPFLLFGALLVGGVAVWAVPFPGNLLLLGATVLGGAFGAWLIHQRGGSSASPAPAPVARHPTHQALLILAVLCLGAAVLGWARDFMRVDACLDRGGAFDYAREQCITTDHGPVRFPVVPYSTRHRMQVVVLTSLGVASLAGLLAMRALGSGSHE
jgi:hypothetical protein